MKYVLVPDGTGHLVHNNIDPLNNVDLFPTFRITIHRVTKHVTLEFRHFWGRRAWAGSPKSRTPPNSWIGRGLPSSPNNSESDQSDEEDSLSFLLQSAAFESIERTEWDAMLKKLSLWKGGKAQFKIMEYKNLDEDHRECAARFAETLNYKMRCNFE